MIVADTNLIASLYVENGMVELAQKVLKKDSHWIAPNLWLSEFRNVISLYCRKQLISYPDALFALSSCESFMYGKTVKITSRDVMRNVFASTCTAYDCEFVSLAQQKKIPLITFDKKILREFPDEAIHPEVFLATN